MESEFFFPISNTSSYIIYFFIQIRTYAQSLSHKNKENLGTKIKVPLLTLNILVG